MTESNEFLFELPPPYPELGDMENTVLQMSAMGHRLSDEERTRVAHKDGRPENVGEHSLTLVLTATSLAARFYPDLDLQKVTYFAAIHDSPEAYVGDVATDKISDEDLLTKERHEVEGAKKLVLDYESVSPYYTIMLQEYENQESLESRFVRMMDKAMPIATAFYEGGEAIRSSESPEGLRARSQKKRAKFKEEYPEFEEVVDIAFNLAQLASYVLYPTSGIRDEVEDLLALKHNSDIAFRYGDDLSNVRTLTLAYRLARQRSVS